MLSRAGAVTLGLFLAAGALATGCGSSTPIPLNIGDLQVRSERPAVEGQTTGEESGARVPARGGDTSAVEIPESFPLSITFRRGRATLDRTAKKTLDEVAGVLGEHPELTLVEVAGHGSAKDGKPEKRERLSQTRSRAVTRYLVSNGVDRGRLFTIHHADRCPAILTNDPGMDQENRRVEISIVQVNGATIEREDSCPSPMPDPDTASLGN